MAKKTKAPKPSDKEARRIFLVDGSALAYRSHYAFIRRPLINSRGFNTSAVFGFVTTLLKLRDDEKPDLVVVVFDAPQKTFRHEKFPDYKATREKMPDDMAAQVPYIFKVVEAMGLPVVTLPGFEADDVIGTYAVQGAAAGHEMFMVTADKDFAQLVGERVRLYNPWAKAGEPTELGPAEVKDKFGVGPERIRDYLALIGDSSDNIPGVPSIGAKTAVKLLEKHGGLEAMLADTGKVSAKRARENLEQHRDQARLSFELVTIDTASPTEQALEELAEGEPDREALGALFNELEFRELHKRFSKTATTEAVRYAIARDEAALNALLDELEAADEVVFDLETTGLDPMTARIVGLAFSCRSQTATYVPVRVTREAKKGETGSLFPEPEADGFQPLKNKRLRAFLADPKIKKGGQNIKYDVRVLAARGIAARGLAFDTLLESYLLDPAARSHGLDDLSLRYLSYRKIATKDLLGSGRKKKTMDELPVETVAKYAGEDADITFRLHVLFSEQMERREDLKRLYREVELPLLEILIGMEQRGVKVDTKVLAKLSKEFEDKAEELRARAVKLAGQDFNLNSPKQLQEVLYQKLAIHKIAKVRPKKTGKGDLSTDVSVLERLAEHHALPKIILEYRSFTKLKGTYVDALPKLINKETGRVHTSFNQAVAATGRLSSSDPNLQNIPIRSPEGLKIRGAFIAGEKGWKLLSADYSQVELRLLAHFSQEPALIEAFQEGADIHRATAARVFGVEPDAVTALQRSRAKAINFGIIYGMGAKSLARQIESELQEAQDFIDNYFKTYPGVRSYLDGQIEHAREKGYVETVLKRRRDLPDIHNPNERVQANAERMATNTPIQGSAADLIKLAMIGVDRALKEAGLDARMLLQVHDELVFEAPEGEVEALSALVRREMEGAFALRVPLVVEVGVGDSWLEAH